MEYGTVKWFSAKKGYGFVIRDGIPEGDANREIFVHYSSIDMQGYKVLLPGLRVKYEIKEGKKKGSIEATNVSVTNPA